jgi:hypothetical protein
MSRGFPGPTFFPASHEDLAGRQRHSNLSGRSEELQDGRRPSQKEADGSRMGDGDG